MLTHALHRLVDAQDRWARPLGRSVTGWISPRLGKVPSFKGFLNGTWLGHPLHAAITDVPVGAFTLALILDLLGQDAAADIALGIGILTMVAAAVTGSADLTDTHGRSQVVSTVHAAAMTVAFLVLVTSLVLRVAGGDARGLGVVLGFLGYAVLIVGTYVGGEVVYALGNQVNRHAWRSGGSRSWQSLEVEDVPEGRPVQARFGSQMLVLVRRGESIHALQDECAHAEGPLSKGTIEDDCIECPWHGSRFELATGTHQRGPALYDQPRYEVRRADSGGWEARRMPSR